MLASRSPVASATQPEPVFWVPVRLRYPARPWGALPPGADV